MVNKTQLKGIIVLLTIVFGLSLAAYGLIVSHKGAKIVYKDVEVEGNFTAHLVENKLIIVDSEGNVYSQELPAEVPLDNNLDLASTLITMILLVIVIGGMIILLLGDVD